MHSRTEESSLISTRTTRTKAIFINSNITYRTLFTILNYVEIDTEQEMLGYGIGIIMLNIGMYFVAPAVVIVALKNRRK